MGIEAETAVYFRFSAEKSDVIVGTREEFDMMEKLLNYKESNDQVTAERWFSYRAQIVVIKHGGEGSIAYTRDGDSHRGGIFKTKVLKTFGAGDSYASAFIYGLMQGLEIPQAMRLGGASSFDCNFKTRLFQMLCRQALSSSTLWRQQRKFCRKLNKQRENLERLKE